YTIFKLLPDFYQQKRRENVGECFISGTPGNFYGRLFPNNHIDFFHSSYSVHWLSQAPKDLTKNAEPLNKGDIYFSKTSPPFSRFEELTLDGLMVLTFLGRETTNFNTTQGVIGMVLKEMVKEGLVEEEKLDLFDFPAYYPTVEEVKQLIEEEGSFTLQTIKTFKMGWDANLEEDIVDDVVDSKMRGEFIAKYIRAVYEPLFIAEFGENIMDELFSRYAKMITELIEIETLEFINIVLFVTKNS
ncbi:hypothetical protein TSUD_327110, partial [Trifolium subterraneum]